MIPYSSISVFIWGFIKEMEKDFLPGPVVTEPWSNGFKQKEDMFRLDTRKNFFTMRVLSPAFVREIRLDNL